MQAAEKEREAAKWRKLALGITIVGVILVAIPWEPLKLKLFTLIPLYLMFVYVYYKYFCLRREARELAAAGESGNAAPVVAQISEHTKGKGKKKGKKSKKTTGVE